MCIRDRNKNEILKKVDHTVLAQTATWKQIKNICIVSSLLRLSALENNGEN